MGNIKNKTVLITGGNSGLGFETAKTLAMHGAQVYIACRHEKKGQQAVSAIKNAGISGSINLLLLDLSNLRSIYYFCQGLDLNKIDVLINNAGVMCMPHLSTTEDGLETQMGVNYFGHFALTLFLLEKLRQSADPRVIHVSSIAAYHQRLWFNNINADIRYSPYGSYKMSKLCNLLFSHELGQRNPWLKSITVHPGVVFTNIQKDASLWLKSVFWVMKGLHLSQPIEQGILPILVAATSTKVRSGMYLGPKYMLKGPVTQVRKPIESRRKTKSRQLWELSQNIVSTITPYIK